jgi:hypothetical protein
MTSRTTTGPAPARMQSQAASWPSVPRPNHNNKLAQPSVALAQPVQDTPAQSDKGGLCIGRVLADRADGVGILKPVLNMGLIAANASSQPRAVDPEACRDYFPHIRVAGWV